MQYFLARNTTLLVCSICQMRRPPRATQPPFGENMAPETALAVQAVSTGWPEWPLCHLVTLTRVVLASAAPAFTKDRSG
jgi:hypothetical protein